MPRRSRTRSSLRRRFKRRSFASKRRYKRSRKFSKRKSATGRRVLSTRTRQSNGFPRSMRTQLKYCDTIEAIRPYTEGAVFEGLPGQAFFAANDPGEPDFSDYSTESPGGNPHQPLGYDQYALLYKRCKVSSSLIKVTVNFATQDGFHGPITWPVTGNPNHGANIIDPPDATQAYAIGGGAPGFDTEAYQPAVTQRLPVGMYIGLVMDNTQHMLAMPKTYAQYLERFKAPMKFIPYDPRFGGYKSVTLRMGYRAPNQRYARAISKTGLGSAIEIVSRADHTNYTLAEVEQTLSDDPLVARTGDIKTTSMTGTTKVEFQKAPPRLRYRWRLVVYYPDSSGNYVIGGALGHDGITMRATVQMWYNCTFFQKRQLTQSSLYSTPGMNEGAADRGADPDEHGGAAVIDITDVTDGVHDQTGETDQEAVA